MTRKLSREEKRVTELVRQRMKESKSSELLGFDVESVHDGRAIFRLDVRPRHKQIHGVVHGGILAALADTAAAIAAYTAVPKGVELVTLELKINYLEPVLGGRLWPLTCHQFTVSVPGGWISKFLNKASCSR